MHESKQRDGFRDSSNYINLGLQSTYIGVSYIYELPW